MMHNNLEATWRYRRAVKAAVRQYEARKRTIWAAWGKPIPLHPDCASAMINAWAECRIAWRLADAELQRARECEL